MKLLIILFLFTFNSFAAETKTECPWMKEMNQRSNPKSNMALKNDKLKKQAKTVNVQ